MSVYLFVVVWAVAGQAAGDDRYGPPPSGMAAELDAGDAGGAEAGIPPSFAAEPLPTSPPPASLPTGAERGRKVLPPPPFVPADDADSVPTNPPGAASAGPARQGFERAAAPPPRLQSPSALMPPGAVAPPVATSPADVAPPSGDLHKPAAMMRSLLAITTGSRLVGRPTRLAEALAGATTREEQARRIDAYWDLSSSVGDYHLSLREQDELQRLRSTVASVGPVWQQAEAALGVRVGTAERAAVASQYRLGSMMGIQAAAQLPLPVDYPHCGDYYARYEQVFAGRESPEARQLSELLPMRYEELCEAAAAVRSAEEFRDQVASQRGGDGTGTLKALELLALRRRAFVQIARDYNRRIARYAELSAPPGADSEQLVAMLIMTGTGTARRPAQVPPASRQSQLSPVHPGNTFAEGWESVGNSLAGTGRDEQVVPAAASAPAETKREKPRVERSLLVPAN